MEKWEWLVDIFTFIGMIVCVIVTLIAIVWLTCFFVKLLVKTFNVRVGKSYDLMVEDITKKAEAKKERNQIKRKEKAEKKMEILNMKLESKQKVHEMRKAKLAKKLELVENAQKQKLLGEDAANVNIEVSKKEYVVNVKEEPIQKEEPKEDVEVLETIVQVEQPQVELEISTETNNVEPEIEKEQEEQIEENSKKKSKK